MTDIKIEELEKDINDLKQKRFKLPAKPPAIYKRSDGNFQLYADNLENYFDVLNVGDDERSRLLLTFLSNEDYQTITRVYPAKKLATEKYSVVAEKLSHLLSDNISSAHALSKLIKLKQNNMNMIDFIKKLEHLAQIAFPEDDMKDAKERCLIHTLQNNCRSKVLAYEIYTFVKSAKPNEKKDFSEVTLKCLELDQVLGKDENDSDEDFKTEEKMASILNVSKEQKPPQNTSRCFRCGEIGHFKKSCTSNLTNVNNSFNNNEKNNNTHESRQNFNNSPHCNNYIPRNNFESGR